VEIHSTWHGIGRGQTTELSIYPGGDGYYLSSPTIEIQPVAPGLVESLLKALSDPPRSGPSLEALGLAPDWLMDNSASLAAKAVGGMLIGGSKVPAKDIEPFFRDPVAMQTAAEELFKHRHTDDSPSVQVDISYEDGTSDSASSNSQFPLMLPWRVQFGGHNEIAYNGEISRALAALMPDKSANRLRLSDTGLPTELARSTIGHIVAKWSTEDLEKRTGDALVKLRSKYEVSGARFTTYPMGNGKMIDDPDDEYLFVRLSASTFPTGFTDEVTLRVIDGKVPKIDAFLRAAPTFERLARSVPWLNEFLPDHPQGRFYVSFVDAASLDDESMKQFSADMQAIGREELIPKVKAVKAQIALLTVGTSDWLVFPDGRMLLWRITRLFSSPPVKVLGWPVDQLHFQPCAGTNQYLYCSGGEISPRGELEPVP